MEIRPTRRETEFFVSSETGEGEYQVINVNGQWKCTCKAFLKTKQPCKHVGRLLEYLKETEGGREEEEDHIADESEMMTPPPTSQNGVSKWIKKIHGKDFISYEGLLAMAHEKGLKEMGAAFISVTETLALAYAWATFKGGKSFWEAGDATPTNVHFQVKPHFPRLALTRAKARVLRDALNIGMVSVEELEE
jgi:SWIM zinc finger